MSTKYMSKGGNNNNTYKSNTVIIIMIRRMKLCVLVYRPITLWAVLWNHRKMANLHKTLAQRYTKVCLKNHLFLKYLKSHKLMYLIYCIRHLENKYECCFVDLFFFFFTGAEKAG